MSRQDDKKIAEGMGWRVSHDPWWNWHKKDEPPGFYFDPPGDEWCIRKDGRKDIPCNEALPHFSTDQSALHNALAGNIVARIVKPPIDTGGTYMDVLVLLESVVMGVLLIVAKLGGDEKVLDTLVEGVRGRLAKARLTDIEPGGSA